MKICEDASDPSLRIHPLISLANCEQPDLLCSGDADAKYARRLHSRYMCNV